MKNLIQLYGIPWSKRLKNLRQGDGAGRIRFASHYKKTLMSQRIFLPYLNRKKQSIEG